MHLRGLTVLLGIGIAYEKIMLNFNNTLTSKIISLAVAVSFLLADISYAGVYQQDSLRVPVGEGETYNRKKRAGGREGEARPSVSAPAAVNPQVSLSSSKHYPQQPCALPTEFFGGC